MLREFKEEGQIVPLLEQQVRSPPIDDAEEAKESPQVPNNVFSDPGPSTRRDVSIRGTEIGSPISASLGAMRPLVGKLDMLLQAPLLQGCSNSKRVKKLMEVMRLLKDDVEKMDSYLDQLSEVDDPPMAANCWMNEARNLSYDMEDYIDSLIFAQPEHPSLVPNNIKTTRSGLKFRFFLKFFSHAKTTKTQVVSIAETLSEFRMYVQEAIERHQRYSLHSCSTLKRWFVPVGPTVPVSVRYDEEAAHIVVDGWMSEFINSLGEDQEQQRQQQLKVIAILGPSSLGKTTLAKLLYSRIGKQYHCRAFIRVSKKPDMKRIFRDILSQLQHPDPPQDFKGTDLIDNIKIYLRNKRYLIIIDDLWETSVWDIISHAFPEGSRGSTIVTTTQIEDVAVACSCHQSGHVFEMKPLDDDHSRKLFFNRLFGSEMPTSERSRQALNLSYNNLPRYLKTCLLYLNMYPEGYTFLKGDLVKQWVAEGLIYTTEGQDIEKVAESYLYQLIGRSFIQPMCVNYYNEVLSCQVHDMNTQFFPFPSSLQQRISREYAFLMVDVFMDIADDPTLEVQYGRIGVKAFTQDLIAGGTESSAVTVEWAMSELMRRPAAFDAATEELDRVVGRDRWVTEKDMPNLPYIEAVVKESMRMHPIVPLLIPRMAQEDATIDGYNIPKGARVLINVWAIGRDPELWDAPEEFMPERFLGSKMGVIGQDLELLSFGSGRRMCPGYNLGLKVVHLSLANLLHGFTWRLPEGVRKEDLSMEEVFGLSTGRKYPLHGFN
uniref:Cytochrome P450 76C1 n=1 Tax=Aegilops tauschii TaxID=37682 RepID=M8BF80_AEGTA